MELFLEVEEGCGGEVGADAVKVEEELDVACDGEGGDDAGDLVVEGYAEVE